MANLKAKTRNALPASDFGMPGERKYPMPDKSHAVNAEARAKQQLNAGRLSASEYKAIVAKARRKISGRQYADLNDYMKRAYPGDEGE